jgi:hypothetical protein
LDVTSHLHVYMSFERDVVICFSRGSTGGWCNDMPEFFQGMPNGVMDNIYDDLDDSPVTWHITEPVDPTDYQNEYIGNVINIY